MTLLGSSIAQAATYNFDGGKIDGCDRQGKEYTCASSPWLKDTDRVVIASGYTLTITTSVTVGYNQGLSMFSKSVLVVTGNLNIAGVNPGNLTIAGGDIEVDGIFSMGALAQTLTGNVFAGVIQLGTDRVTVTGNLKAAGLVSISSGSRITGNVGGSVITTDSSVTITGNVTAGNKFSLASGGTVTGDIIAPVFDMLATNTRVTGDITATTSMTMGSGNTVTGSIKTAVFDMQASGSRVTGPVTATTKMTMGSGNAVTGDVDTGDLLLQSSSAIITGNARVNWATLEYAGRVTGTIYCKNGTAKGQCDCVTNNSGYQVNTANGPRCEGTAPKGPHHLQITHDGVGDTCLPEKITVTACANATCTAPHYNGAVSGTISGLGVPFSIGANAGAVVVNATRFSEGTVTLGIDATTTCYQSANNSNSCAMSFSGGAKLLVNVDNHVAGAGGIMARIRAVKANQEQNACVAAFTNVSYPVQYSCNYNKPKTGSLPLVLGSSAGETLSCGAAGATGTAKAISTAFDSDGWATPLPLKYADAGELTLKAVADTGKGMTARGEGSFVTAPAAFKLVTAAGPLRANADFGVTVTALNAAGGTTPNFDTKDLNDAGATAHDVALDVACRAQGGEPGIFVSSAAFTDGVAKTTARWSEVGRIELQASLTNFMGITGLGATGRTNAACTGTVGPFLPQYFKLTIERPPAETARTFHYAQEPFTVRVIAMSKTGTVTKNYDKDILDSTTPSPYSPYSETLTVSAVAASGAAFDPAPGVFNTVAPTTPPKVEIPASAFEDGSATVKVNYSFPAVRTAPQTIRLRATNGKAAPADVSSAYAVAPDPDPAKEAQTTVRSGRMRIGSRFGGLKGTLSIPVSVEYWTGKSWLLNSEDSYTRIPKDSIALKPTVSGMTIKALDNPLQLAGGAAAFDLSVLAGGPGPVDIAINLGSSLMDNACIGDTAGTKLHTQGAAIPWLRPEVTGCGTTMRRDPSGRATFGVYTPENRRIIHVREVFN